MGATRTVHCLAHAELVGTTHRFHSGLPMSPTLVGEFVDLMVQQASQVRPGPARAPAPDRAGAWRGVAMPQPAAT